MPIRTGERYPNAAPRKIFFGGDCWPVRLRSLAVARLNFWRYEAERLGAVRNRPRAIRTPFGDVKRKLHITRFHSCHRDVEEALVTKRDVAIDLYPFRVNLARS